MIHISIEIIWYFPIKKGLLKMRFHLINCILQLQLMLLRNLMQKRQWIYNPLNFNQYCMVRTWKIMVGIHTEEQLKISLIFALLTYQNCGSLLKWIG